MVNEGILKRFEEVKTIMGDRNQLAEKGLKFKTDGK